MEYVVTEVTKDGEPRVTPDKTVAIELKGGGLSFNPRGAPILFHLKRK